MPESARPESASVEQIMEQIRARIREKRGVESSEQQVRELAAAKLEKLFEQVRRARPPAPAPNFVFDRRTIFDSPSGLARVLRALFRPIVRLFVNPDAVADALHTQAQINARQAELEAGRHRLYDELIQNLVIESARTSLEIKQLRMRVESLSSRLEFSERRTRTLESTMTYRPAAEERHAAALVVSQPPPFVPEPGPAPPSMASASLASASAAPPSAGTAGEWQPPSVQPGSPSPSQSPPGPPGSPLSDGQRRRRRRRRRGRRRGGMGGPMGNQPPGTAPGGSQPGAGGPPQAGDVPPPTLEQPSADVFGDEDGDEPANEGGNEPGPQ